MKTEQQEQPESTVASEPETQLWETPCLPTQAGNMAESTETMVDGAGGPSGATHDLLRHTLGKDIPLGRVGH